MSDLESLSSMFRSAKISFVEYRGKAAPDYTFVETAQLIFTFK